MNKSKALLIITIITSSFISLLVIDTWRIMRELHAVEKDLERFEREFNETFKGRSFEEEFDQHYDDQKSSDRSGFYVAPGSDIYLWNGVGRERARAYKSHY